MEINRALEQIDEIYGHLERTEVYRGYRPLPVAASGVLAIAAGVLQGVVVTDGSRTGFVLLWVLVAALSAALVAAEIAYGFVTSKSAAFRRTTLRAVCQFLPCVAVGALVTLAVPLASSDAIPALPGIWSLIFCLGIFASRPYLPRAIGWVGLFYFLAGAWLLALTASDASLSPWGMGITFGGGQIGAATVLYWKIERRTDGQG